MNRKREPRELSLFYFLEKMHEQIRQGDSLTAPLTVTPPQTAILESSQTVQNIIPSKPLDFLLPFAVAANMNAGLNVRENLRTVAAQLRSTRQSATDSSFHLLDFLIAEARLPFAGDPVKPWDYQGWLLPYVILANAVRADVANRWGWWAACHLNDKLVAEPIPHIHFQSEFGPGGKDAFKIIDRCLEIIGRGTGGSWSSFNDFIEWLAWGCGVGDEKPNFSDRTNEELYKTFDLEPFLTRPSDYLGEHLAERKGKGWNPNAFFPTPHTVCEFMTQINFIDARCDNGAIDSRMMTVCDPALGTGRQLMHASNFSVRLYGMDIDRLVVKICLINGAMFVPWMSFPFPNKWFEQHDAARLAKPDEKFVLAEEHENKRIAAEILERLKIKFPNQAVN